MASYIIKVTIGNKKTQRRGERETLRYKLLKALSTSGESLVTLRSVRVRKVG